MKELLEKIIGGSIRDVVKLHGDASYRIYYRAILNDGSTRIVMQMPPGKSSVSEEITNFKGVHKELPYININKFLSSLGLPVPKIYTYSDSDKIMILEDIGDGFLAKFVKDAGNKAREGWYKKAVDLLVELQKRTALHPLPSPLGGLPSGGQGEGRGEGCVALERSFDAYLLNWEFDHFREYLVEARLGKPMKNADRRLFEEETRKITEEILKIPYCFTHRDFQSRNLMVQDDESLTMIDFQDALIGPCVYDLAALLRDSYVELEWSLVKKLVDYYSRKKSVSGFMLHVPGWFNLVTIQRKMKDAGRFVFIDRVKKNPNFLQYIPISLKYVKNAFNETQTLKHLNTQTLFNMLKTYVPEWK